jgi:hypothetical protein
MRIGILVLLIAVLAGTPTLTFACGGGGGGGGGSMASEGVGGLASLALRRGGVSASLFSPASQEAAMQQIAFRQLLQQQLVQQQIAREQMLRAQADQQAFAAVQLEQQAREQRAQRRAERLAARLAEREATKARNIARYNAVRNPSKTELTPTETQLAAVR